LVKVFSSTFKVSKLKKKILENQRLGGVTGRNDSIDSTLNGGDQETDNGRTRDGDLLPETDLEVQLLHSRAERAEIWRYYHNEKNTRQKNENHLELLKSMYKCINQTVESSTTSDGSDSVLEPDADVNQIGSGLASAIICPICNLTLKYI